MKKILLIINVLSIAMCLNAQPTSLWLTPMSGINNCSIIKEWTGGYAIGACADIASGNKALSKVLLTASSYPLYYESYVILHDSILNVSDMYIVDDEVFFCGNAKNNGQVVGYLGHVNANSFYTSDYIIFDDLSLIGSLVAYEESSGYKIVAVGHKPYTSESFVGKQYIIEADHNGASFLSTATPPNNDLYAFTADDEIPVNITLTDRYVAITGNVHHTDYRFFVIRCDRSSPVATAQKYDFADPDYLQRIPTPTIENLHSDLVAVAYATIPGSSYRIVVHTLDLTSMAVVNSQGFDVEAKNPAPRMAYFDATRTLVLLSSDNLFPLISSAMSSFVYIDPLASPPYLTTYAYQSLSTINLGCYSISRFGAQHFMGHTNEGWYLHNQPSLSVNSSSCLLRTDIRINKVDMLSVSPGTINNSFLPYWGNVNSGFNYFDIDMKCYNP